MTASSAEGAVEVRFPPQHRGDDDNARRHAGFFALNDWLAGSDQQWLYATGEDNAYYSHDHGLYFPGGPNWTPELLEQNVDTEYALGADQQGLDHDELTRLATELEQIAQEDIDRQLSNLPADWPVTDEELEAVATFADQRRQPVAERIRSLASGGEQ